MTAQHLEMPKWACLSVIAFSATTIVAQCLVDIYQGTSSAPFLSPEWLLQAYNMSLPTFGSVAFALFCGWLLNIQQRVIACLIFVLAACFMLITTSNGWDFMAAQTVNKTTAAAAKSREAKEIADIQNKLAAKERAEMTEELWRTYTTTTSHDRKAQVLSQIKEATKSPLDLQTGAVETANVGSGSIFHSRLGWRPEAVQEAKALALPALLMIAKMLGLTLGFGFWPRGKSETVSERKRPEKPVSPSFNLKTSKRDAETDLKALIADGRAIPSQRWLAKRWGVSDACVVGWLNDWGISRKRQMVGHANQLANGHANGRVQ